jgi:hypothetical protein
MAHHCPAHHPRADWQRSHAAADWFTVLEDLIDADYSVMETLERPIVNGDGLG